MPGGDEVSMQKWSQGLHLDEKVAAPAASSAGARAVPGSQHIGQSSRWGISWDVLAVPNALRARAGSRSGGSVQMHPRASLALSCDPLHAVIAGHGHGF